MPLAVLYCSNPLELGRHRSEIDAATWVRVIGEPNARRRSRFEPTRRRAAPAHRLETIAAGARRHQMYTNLITSGVPLTRERLRALKMPGSCRELSFRTQRPRIGNASQASTGGARSSTPLGSSRSGPAPHVNVVLHRENLGRVDRSSRWRNRWGRTGSSSQHAIPGWALANRARLLPRAESSTALAMSRQGVANGCAGE